MLCLLQSASTKPKAVMWVLLVGWVAPRGEPEVWGEKCSIRPVIISYFCGLGEEVLVSQVKSKNKCTFQAMLSPQHAGN